MARLAKLNKIFHKMIGCADIVFTLFAELPWTATRSAAKFVECLVLLARTHGLDEAWKGMFVQLGFGLVNTFGRVVFTVALESMLKKFEQIARFATVHGERFMLPRLYKLCNRRALEKIRTKMCPFSKSAIKRFS